MDSLLPQLRIYGLFYICHRLPVSELVLYPIFTCFRREMRRFDWPRLSSSSYISCTGLYLVR